MNSVQNQTFQNFEIICVDDYSSDNSTGFILERMKEDPRIKGPVRLGSTMYFAVVATIFYPLIQMTSFTKMPSNITIILHPNWMLIF